MPSALTLVIYVSAAVAADPNTATLQRSAQEILGDEAQVTLRASAGTVPDEALSGEGTLADGVADVSWQNDEHRRATVRCYVGKLHRIVKRDVSFEEDSDLAERERMLGFVVASMLLPEPEPELAEPGPAPQEPPKKESVPPKPSPPPPPPPTEHFTGMVELLGLGASGLGGAGSGYGAGLAARWFFARSLSARVALGLRNGQVPAANANTRAEFASFGLGVTVPLGAGSRFALGGHAGPLLLRQEAERRSTNTGIQEQKSRLVLGAEGCFEAGVRLSGAASFVAGLGTELAFGRTVLLVKGNQVAEISALSGLAELGIQVQF